MVENSLGSLRYEGHPDEAMKSEWKYYLDEAEQEAEVQKQLDAIKADYATIKPEEIKIIDIKTPRLIQYNYSSADFAA